MMLTLALIIVATVPVVPQTLSTAGSIVGCITDIVNNQRLPGATVVAKGGGVGRTAVAGDSGCYELKDLPPASYRVTARVSGFDNVTLDRLAVAPSKPTRINFTMRLSPICECVRVTGSLAEQLNHADAVLHVRLSASEPAPSTPQGYYRHAATVLAALKRPDRARPGSIFVVQNQRSGVAGLYDVGQELVVFLKFAGADAFRITNDEPGLAVPTGSQDPSMAFLVQDGHIQRAPQEFGRYVGLSIAAFLNELRTVSQRK
jgi:hypothetical protein